MRWALEPEDQLADRGAAAQADDDEVGVGLVGDRDEVLGGLVAPHQLAHLELEAVAGQLVADPLELGLGGALVVVVEVTAAAVGVDDDEPGLARLRLLDRAGRAARPSLVGTNPTTMVTISS